MPKKQRTDVKNEVYLTAFQKQSIELLNELNKCITTDELAEDCEDLVKWVTAVNTMTDDFSIKDEDGKLPVLDKLSINAFRDAYISALKVCDDMFVKYPADDGDKAHKDIRKATEKIRDLLFKDSMIFEQGDLEGLTLDQAIEKKLGKYAADLERNVFSSSDREGIEDEDTICVEFPAGTELNVIGNISERNPISFIDEKGNRINGFFTEKQNLDYRERYDQITEKTVRKAKKDNVDPLWIEVLERTNTYMKDFIKDPKDFRWDNYDLKKLGYEDYVVKILKEDQKFVEYYTDYLNKLGTVDTVIRVGYYNSFAATAGSSIDKRNTAMYGISKLLGKDNLLAESKNAQILVGDVLVEGTFMEEVKGYSGTTFPEDHPALELKDSVFDGSMALRDIADLDILDYICQNIDRHTDNMIFSFSEDGKKCTGIKGIDNDFSFGTSRSTRAHSHDSALSNIKIISEGMVQKIESLSDTALRTSLAKKGLSEREVNESISRLLNVKDKIHNGDLRVVKDDEWASMKLADLPQRGNYFGKIYDCFESEIQEAVRYRKTGIEGYGEKKDIKFTEGKKVNAFDYQRENDYFLKDRAKNKGEVFAESLTKVYDDEYDNSLDDTEKIKTDDEMIELFHEWADTMKNSIKSGNSKLHGASQYYIDLNTKIDEFEKLAHTFKKGSFLSPANYNAILDSMDELIQAGEDYLEHVEDIRTKDGSISKTQKKRSDLVQDMLDVAKAGRPIAEHNHALLKAEYERSQADLFKGLIDPEAQYIKEPAKTIYTKLREIQKNITPNHFLGDLAYEQRVAEILFLTGIAKNMDRLQRNNDLILVVGKDNIGKHIHTIKNSEAFKQMLKSAPKEEIIRMAKSPDAKELFDHYSKCQYDVERKPVEKNKKKTVKPPAQTNVMKK